MAADRGDGEADRFGLATGSVERASCRYASRYCEENVWHLARDPRFERLRRHVVFITNALRTCVFFAQSAAPSESALLWDYHVVFLAGASARGRVAHTTWVFDLDSRLPLPSGVDEYVSSTFLAGRADLREEVRPRFRVIDAAAFLEVFASDRSHMRRGRRWLAPPPPWPCIGGDGSKSNLSRFLDMNDAGVPGEWLDLDGFCDRFGARPMASR